MSSINVKESVKEYYGDELKSSEDLKTNACTTADVPVHIRRALTNIEDEIISRYYGCGSPIPFSLDGLHALDVGCGTGRDVYVLSQLVGEGGFVTGIDMTENQLSVAKKHLPAQMKRFGYEKENVHFILDEIENIPKHIEAASLDLITSNCVLNLAEDKSLIMKHLFQALKEGGEMYFADIYADRRNPKSIRDNDVLYGECLGGALYERDFEQIARDAGFTFIEMMARSEVSITNPEVKEITGERKFFSVTYRLFKLPELEPTEENYGDMATYLGTCKEAGDTFDLDRHSQFTKGEKQAISRNIKHILSKTRFAKHFEVSSPCCAEHQGAFLYENDSERPITTSTGSCC